MAIVKLILPQINVNDRKAKVVEWHVADKSRVVGGDLLVTVETAKAAEDIEAPSSGFIQIVQSTGSLLGVGDTLAVIAESEMEFESIDVSEIGETPQTQKKQITDKARRLADQLGVDINAIDAQGIVTEAKVRSLAALSNSEAGEEGERQCARSRRSYKLGPVAEAAMHAVLTSQMDTATTHMTAEADITDLLALWKNDDPSFSPAFTLTDILVHVVARALQEFPKLNASFISGFIEEFEEIDVSVTSDLLGELYLITVFDAEKLLPSEIGAERQRIAREILSGNNTTRDVSGGTFAISVLEQPAIINQVPIIFPGHAGILGVGAVQDKYRRSENGDQLNRKVLGLTLSYDHRFINGLYAARFLQHVSENLLPSYETNMSNHSKTTVDLDFAGAHDSTRNLLANVLDCDPVDLEESAKLNNFPNWDSMAQINIILAIENATGVPVGNMSALKLTSLGAIDAYLSQAEHQTEEAMLRPFDGTNSDLRHLLDRGLGSIGVEAGESIVVHAFLGGLLQLPGAVDIVLDALERRGGKKGTVFIPAFTSAFTEQGKMDRNASPSETGLLGDRALRRSGVSITSHPYHRFIVLGASRDTFVASHPRSSFGPGSPMDHIFNKNGKIVLISVDWEPVTFFHYIEEVVGVPYRYEKTFRGQITTESAPQAEEWTMFVRRKGEAVQNNFAAFGEKLRQEGLTKSVAHGPLIFESSCAKDVFEFTRHALAENPYCLVKNG